MGDYVRFMRAGSMPVTEFDTRCKESRLTVERAFSRKNSWGRLVTGRLVCARHAQAARARPPFAMRAVYIPIPGTSYLRRGCRTEMVGV